MTAKVEYSFSVPADSNASASVIHTPGGTNWTVECDTPARFDLSHRVWNDESDAEISGDEADRSEAAEG